MNSFIKKTISLLSAAALLTGCGEALSSENIDDIQNQVNNYIDDAKANVEDEVSTFVDKNLAVAYLEDINGITSWLDFDGKLTISGNGAFDSKAPGDMTITVQGKLSHPDIILASQFLGENDIAVDTDGKFIADFSYWQDIFGDEIKSVEISDGITAIKSFTSLSNIKEITIPDSVTEISDYAFFNCANLESVTITDNITVINAGAFSQCINLKNIVLPNGLTEIGEEAFFRCENLHSIQLPQSLKIIGKGAFECCSNLESVDIQEGVEIISDRAFIQCSSLRQLSIPSSFMSVGTYDYDCQIADYSTVLIVDNNTYAHAYADKHGYDYKIMDSGNHDDNDSIDISTSVNSSPESTTDYNANESTDNNYKEIYMNYINENILQSYSHFDFYDLDNDGIPELFLSDGWYHMAQVDIFTVWNGDVICLAEDCGAYGYTYVYEKYISCGGWSQKIDNNIVACAPEVQEQLKNEFESFLYESYLYDSFVSVGNKYALTIEEVKNVLNTFS